MDEPTVLDFDPNIAAIDWRDKGAANAVQDQGDCGSCWVFSAAADVEVAYAIDNGDLNKYSEQQLVDCVTKCNSCNGGTYFLAWMHLQEQGAVSEEDYPSVDINGPVPSKC